MLLVLGHRARRHPESTSVRSPDYAYADAYLNANAWHSDNQKARAYQDARDDQKKHYEKCAEIRVVSAIEIVASLRQWIIDARIAVVHHLGPTVGRGTTGL